MTNRQKRGQTYTGLKILLLVGSLGVSSLGAQILKAYDVPVVTKEAAAAQAASSGPGFDPSELQPIPTALQPQMAPPTPVAPVQAAQQGSSGPGNPPAVQSGGGQQAAAPQGGEAFVMPTVVAVGGLPPLPPPPSGGGGGGGGGGAGRSS
jgi:hypothetical protein